MTLCMAWRHSGKVHFASDSRASIANGAPFDHCVKVVSIPVKILGPLHQGDPHESTIYEQTVGVCFAGSFLSAYTVKETVTHALASLQAIPDITDVSMDQIANLVHKLYSTITEKTLEVLFKKGRSALLITGYCHRQQSIRTFKLDCVVDNRANFTLTEVLTADNQIEFLGSGKPEAQKRFKDLASTPPLQLLKDIIDEQVVPSVGGAVQFGKIEGREFRVFGIRDFTIDSENRTVHPVFNYNGIDFMADPFAIKWDEFHLRQSYIDPFVDKINRLLAEGYTVV